MGCIDAASRVHSNIHLGYLSGIEKSMLKPNDNLLEWMKWFALVLMTADHINKYIFAEKYTAVFYAGRLVMPLFAFVLAYNLSRPGAMEAGAYQRTMKRLALFGLVATPAYIESGFVINNWYPLNIMFMLLVGVAVAYCLEVGGRVHMMAALTIFLIGGAITEFWFFGVAVFLTSKKYVSDPSDRNFFWLLMAVGSLYIVNGNFWALGAIALILLAIVFSHKRINLPKITRSRKLFYVYYPAHITLLVFVSYLLK